jgi:hypothetical protein
MFRFIVWLIPTLDKLPRSQKFLLGDRMQATALDVFERLIEATYSKTRERALSDANLGLEKLRFLFRVCAELHYLDYSGCGTFRRGWLVGSGAAGADAGIMLQVVGFDARAAFGRASWPAFLSVTVARMRPAGQAGWRPICGVSSRRLRFSRTSRRSASVRISLTRCAARWKAVPSRSS